MCVKIVASSNLTSLEMGVNNWKGTIVQDDVSFIASPSLGVPSMVAENGLKIKGVHILISDRSDRKISNIRKNWIDKASFLIRSNNFWYPIFSDRSFWYSKNQIGSPDIQFIFVYVLSGIQNYYGVNILKSNCNQSGHSVFISKYPKL